MCCNKRKYCLFIFLPLIFLLCNCFAQSDNYSVRTYSVKDGLPDQYILSLFQDSRGFLWIGTANGLSRFDGKHFVNYGFQQKLGYQRVQQVMEDKGHRLWVAAEENIFELQQDHFISYALSHTSVQPFYIFALQQSADGTPRALTTEGAYDFNGTTWVKTYLYPQQYHLTCVDIISTAEGDFYNCRSALLKKEISGSIRPLRTEVNSRIYYNQLSYRNKSLFAAGNDGIFRIGNDGKKTEIFKGQLPPGDWISFMIDSRNRFWVCRNGSNKIYVSAPGNTDTFTDSVLTGANLFSAIFEDKDHNTWIASVAGLFKVQQQEKQHYSFVNNDLINDIRNIVQTTDGRLLAFSREKGILEFNGHTFIKSALQFYHNNTIAKNDFPDIYFIDENNNTWLVTREGRLLEIDGNHFIDHTGMLSGKSPIVWADYNLFSKKIFISQDTLNISSKNSSNKYISENYNRIPFPKLLKCFSNGKTLIVCEGAGVKMIDENNNTVNVNKELGLGDFNSGGMFLDDQNGGFWMCGGSYGLKHFHWNKTGLPQNDMNITDKELGDAIINQACVDAEGRIWAITPRSLIVIKANPETKEVFVKHLSDNSNISIAMPANAKLFTSRGGQVWLTDKNDIYSFNPKNVKFNIGTAQINIENIDVNFTKTNWAEYTKLFKGYWRLPVDPVLKYYENNLQISYSGISFTSPPDLVYSYKLDGLDIDWRRPSSNNIVSYANLPAGKYLFSVRARTPNSDWSTPALFSFTIQPAFWNTWWFRLLLLSLAAAIIIVIFRNHVKKIKNEVVIKNQLTELEMTALKAQMNPHFIYNALNSIQSLVVSEKKEEAIFYIGTFSRLLRQVLDQSENNLVTLEKELQTLDLYIGLESLRLNIKPTYNVRILNNIQTNDEKIPPLTLQPFIENSLWHGLSKKEGEKKITITIAANPLWLTCTMEDNGVGRKKAAALKKRNIVQHQSKAINITFKRLLDLNNDKNIIPVEIEDLYDDAGNATGTKITLHIKRQN